MVLPALSLFFARTKRPCAQAFLHTEAKRFSLTTARVDNIFRRLNRAEHIVKDLVKVMKALADPNRLKIIKMLQQKMMCVCEIQTALNIAQPSVSKHLKVLEDAGLVGFKKDGMWVNYHLTDGSSSPYAATLLGNLRHWLENDQDVSRLVKRLPEIRREVICKK